MWPAGRLLPARCVRRYSFPTCVAFSTGAGPTELHVPKNIPYCGRPDFSFGMARCSSPAACVEFKDTAINTHAVHWCKWSDLQVPGRYLFFRYVGVEFWFLTFWKMKCCTNTVFETISLPFEDNNRIEFHNRRKKSNVLNLFPTLVAFCLSDVSSYVLSVYRKAVQPGDFWRLAWSPYLLLENSYY